MGRIEDRSELPGRLTDTVLFDRDGTLVQDVPYNGDPDAVVAMLTTFTDGEPTACAPEHRDTC